MRFAFIAKHRGIWPVAWLCEALDVSRSGFHAWLTRAPSKRSRAEDRRPGSMPFDASRSEPIGDARQGQHIGGAGEQGTTGAMFLINRLLDR